MNNNYEFDEENNSIATILRKVKINNNLYQFVYDKVVIGHLDNERKVFISSDGEEYYNIKSHKFLDNNDDVFGTYLEKDDLYFVFSLNDDVDPKLYINKYIDYVSSLMYFVKVEKNSKGNYNIQVKDVDLNRIYNSFMGLDDKIISVDDTFVEEVLTDCKKNEDFLDPSYSDNTSITRDINDLVYNIYSCEYNTGQLFTIAENISFLIDYLKTALDTVDLQLQAYYDCDKEPKNPCDVDFEFINSSYDPYQGLGNENDRKKLLEEIIGDRFDTKKRMDLIELRNEIKRYLINQDEALRRVLVEIARMDIKENEKNKGILLMGDSGTGKTYLMELLAEKLDVPFISIDSTQLTTPSYVGRNIEEYLWELYVKCDKDLEKAENAIIFFDEIDKKGSNRKSDSSGQGVLNLLLKFLDGTTYAACQDCKNSNEKVNINTSRMKIIAAGAFNDVFGDKTFSKKNPIGFNNYTEDGVQTLEEEKIPDADTFVQKAFMTHEFMGRFPIRIRLKPHSIESFSKILRESEDSTLKEEEKVFEKLGVKLTVTPEFIIAASDQALKLKTGVRGLMGTIEDSTWVAFEDVYVNPEKYQEIRLTKDSLSNPSNYQKILKK